MKRIAIVAMAGFALAGCAAPSQPGTPGGVTTGIQVQPGREFELAVGQAANVQGTQVVVRFRGASDDSRCPSDVQCVWAGNAVVHLGFSRGEGAETEARVNTRLDPKSAAFAGYSVRVVGLKPVSKSGKPIAASRLRSHARNYRALTK